jgi:hypothetical protein
LPSVEAWSGTSGPPTRRVAQARSRLARANRRARIPREHNLVSAFARCPTFIGFYVGLEDTRFLRVNILLDLALTALTSRACSTYPDGMPVRCGRAKRSSA